MELKTSQYILFIFKVSSPRLMRKIIEKSISAKTIIRSNYEIAELKMCEIRNGLFFVEKVERMLSLG